MATEKQFCGTFIASITDFSDENVHQAGGTSELSDCDIDDEFINVSFVPEFYANGNTVENKGYVSLFFDYPSECVLKRVRYFESVLFISVLDIDGDKRFTQSLSFCWNVLNQGSNISKFGFDKYVSRKDLLCHEFELLPEDTLTLCVDIILVTHAVPGEDNSDEHIESTALLSFQFVNFAHHLRLDSKVGERLSKTSDYFKLMLACPMKEKKTRLMKIVYEEYPAFKNLARIIMEAKHIEAHSILDICMLYAIAKRYNITTVIEACLRLFENLICAENLDVIRELTSTYDDRKLQKIVERFCNNFSHDFQQNEMSAGWNESGRIEIPYTSNPEVFEEYSEFDFYR